MKTSHAFACASLLVASSALQAAGAVHQHGVARLDIAVEAKKISLQLEAPLDTLLGFERAPRNDAERRQTEAALSRLKAAAAMFRIDPAAQCTQAKVALSSAALGLGAKEAVDSKDDHADLDAAFEFDCADASKAAYLDVGLFEFTRLQRLEVQVATPSHQSRQPLKRPATRIVLAKAAR